MELKEQVEKIRCKDGDCGHDLAVCFTYIDTQQKQIAGLSKAHTFCDRHNEDDVDFCPNCAIDEMDDALTEKDKRIAVFDAVICATCKEPYRMTDQGYVNNCNENCSCRHNKTPIILTKG
ncbi:hypothetical protein KAR91_09200 [Candidatus Pacearchaeota archaeon]|nr:hypothetical protein [Candidatus Pacearchaeota archaeon]